jgi:hypothetical protein
MARSYDWILSGGRRSLSSRESILAQEQSVLYRRHGGNEIQGTLILTNNRLLLVAANQEEYVNMLDGLDFLRYADVESLDSIAQSPSNLSVSFDSIVSARGNRGIMTNPSLKVRYNSGSGETEADFVQTIIGGRKKNLNDWARVIDGLKAGTIKIKEAPTWLPDKNSLEGRIVESLSDLQEKGVFEIESEIEKKYGVQLDPDKVEEACGNLVSKGVIEKKEEDFYRMPSPLGADDLSS